jgi:hypothetical protein
MKESTRYTKIIAWSEEDHCYVGRNTCLVLGRCHGKDEQAVCGELCQIVEEAIALYGKDGKPLPPSASGRDFANKMHCAAG